ncbi:MAG: hypothetical protein AAF571_09180 [Verrucomicrobiota bacterium]
MNNKLLLTLTTVCSFIATIDALAVPKNYKYSGTVPTPVADAATNAGRGNSGIPNYPQHGPVVTPKSTQWLTYKAIQDAINGAPNNSSIKLSAGDFVINRSIKMKSNVVLMGSGRYNTFITDRRWATGEALIDFRDGTTDAGLENICVRTNMGAAPDNNYSNLRTGNITDLINMRGNSNWLYWIRALDAANNTVNMGGSNNVVLASIFDGAWNKGPGGRGYFVVKGNRNLIAGNTFTGLRHFSIQRWSSSRTWSSNNVVAANEFYVDMNFHSGDGGSNLIVENNFRVPSFHPWGAYATGVPGQHGAPGPNNFVVRNVTHTSNSNDMPTGLYRANGYGDSFTRWWWSNGMTPVN